MSKKNVFASVLFSLFLFLVTGNVSAQNANSHIYSTEAKSAGSNSYSTTIRLNAQETMAVQGYEMEISFDPNEITITDLTYLVGRVSEGLGDSNTNLQKVNSAGKIMILGEVPTAVGEAVSTGSEKDFVQITYTSQEPSSQAKIDVTKALFYKINQDGSLSSTQVTNDATGAPNTPRPPVAPNAPASKSTPWWLWIIEYVQNLLSQK